MQGGLTAEATSTLINAPIVTVRGMEMGNGTTAAFFVFE
jgi:hypothetical protein